MAKTSKKKPDGQTVTELAPVEVSVLTRFRVEFSDKTGYRDVWAKDADEAKKLVLAAELKK